MPDEPNAIARSRNGIPVRLTEERWVHIVDEHTELASLRSELLRTISDPERIVGGNYGEVLALRTQVDGKVLVAIYREFADDGFVITAFLTRRLATLNRKPLLWPLPESTSS